MKRRLLSLLLAVCMILTMIPASFAAETTFADVDPDEWYADEVAWVKEKGLMNGTSEDLFSPGVSTTRGMIVTILWRLEGEPEAAAATFTDVAADMYYADAVAWAAENKIVEGYGNDLFGPDDTITREQLATIIYRYAKFAGVDVSDTVELDAPDADSVSDWALEAMQWACAIGMINGTDAGLLDPQAPATRAQVAVILYRLDAEGVISADPEEEKEEDKPVVVPPSGGSGGGTVTPPHECDLTYTSNGDGTHKVDCAGCEESYPDAEECEWSYISNDLDDHQQKCKWCSYIADESIACSYDAAGNCVCGNSIEVVAAIGNVGYASLQGAVNAVDSDEDVVVLKADITIADMDNDNYSEAVVYSGTNKLTIDGQNLYSITMAGPTKYCNGNYWKSAAITAENSQLVTLKNVKVINEKYCGDAHVPTDITDLTGKTCGGRKAVYSYVKAGELCFDDVDFVGGIAVFDKASFTDCTFTEGGTKMYALFIDNQYGGNIVDVTMTNCTVAASGYGCVKVADDKNEGGQIEVTGCTFENSTQKKDINANGKVVVIIDGYYQVSSIDDLELVAEISTGEVKVKLTDDITIGTIAEGEYSKAVRFSNATALEIDGGNNQIILVGETQYINGNSWQTAGIYADNADVTIKNVTFQNNKTNGGVKKCGSRFPIYTMIEAKGEGTKGTVNFTEVTFNGGVVVFDDAIFTRCKFNENTKNSSTPENLNEGQMYALFVDHQYDSTGEWVVTIDNCDFVVDNSYGTIKLADDAGAKINFIVKDCDFDVDGTGKDYVVNAGSNCTVTFEGNNSYTGAVTNPQG